MIRFRSQLCPRGIEPFTAVSVRHLCIITIALAGTLGLPLELVSVKATRGEGMGFVGAEEGAAALAIATVERRA